VAPGVGVETGVTWDPPPHAASSAALTYRHAENFFMCKMICSARPPLVHAYDPEPPPM
jgi:hypothetical protein